MKNSRDQGYNFVWIWVGVWSQATVLCFAFFRWLQHKEELPNKTHLEAALPGREYSAYICSIPHVLAEMQAGFVAILHGEV